MNPVMKTWNGFEIMFSDAQYSSRTYKWRVNFLIKGEVIGPRVVVDINVSTIPDPVDHPTLFDSLIVHAFMKGDTEFSPRETFAHLPPTVRAALVSGIVRYVRTVSHVGKTSDYEARFKHKIADQVVKLRNAYRSTSIAGMSYWHNINETTSPFYAQDDLEFWLRWSPQDKVAIVSMRAMKDRLGRPRDDYEEQRQMGLHHYPGPVLFALHPLDVDQIIRHHFMFNALGVDLSKFCEALIQDVRVYEI